MLTLAKFFLKEINRCHASFALLVISSWNSIVAVNVAASYHKRIFICALRDFWYRSDQFSILISG